MNACIPLFSVQRLNDTENSSGISDFHDPEAESLRRTLEMIEGFIYRVPVVIICAFGLLGNLLNLVVLSSKSLFATMERMERSAHLGLTGLAVSDALFCLAVLPMSVVGYGGFGYREFGFRILYVTYSSGIISTFTLSSTWLTVCMAVSRYLAVCHPFTARMVIGKRFSVTSLAVVFLLSTIFSLPRYLIQQISSMECQDGGRLYYSDSDQSLLARDSTAYRFYIWTFFVFGIAVPLAVLAYCNAKLVMTLRRSGRMAGKSYSSAARSSNCEEYNCRTSISTADSREIRCRNKNDTGAANRITLTMIAIVASYIILVVPTEIMSFAKDAVSKNLPILPQYNLLLAVFNMLQAINFAFNFILYCVVNAHFRSTFYRLVHRYCCCRYKSSLSGKASRTGTNCITLETTRVTAPF